MCVHKGTVLLVLLGRFPLFYCFWAGRPKTPVAYTFFMGWVICGVVGEHKHVCSNAYDAHDVAAAARFLVLGLLLLLLGLVCGVVGENNMCVHKHSVAGSAWAVFVVLLLFLGK